MQIKKRYFVGLLLLAMAGGWLTLGGTAYIMAKTSSTEFCVSCHTMQIPYEEYQGSLHFSNAKGIRAECADCHIPKSPLDYVITKVRASKDIYHEFVTGKIDTEDKYEAHRSEMAEVVWQQMRENDSVTCRSCHTREAMDPFEQTKDAVKMHEFGVENGQTCIDCHKGVAHFPPEMEMDSEAFDKLLSFTKKTAVDANIVYPVETIAMGDLGSINPATKLIVTNFEDGVRSVEINAFQMKGAEQVLYVGNGQRSIVAVLTEIGMATVEGGEYKTDDYGNDWRTAKLSAKIESQVLDSLDPLWAYAEELDNVYCSGCHAKIATNHFTVNAWGPVAKSMGERTDITIENLEILTKFFQNHAKDIVVH
jgi:trimethylamine-N-oxide reductase (cytochrome c) cytochrome c-type subunit TorY